MVGKWHGPEIDATRKGWFKTPDAFIDELKSIDGSTLKVYVALMSYRNSQTGIAYPSVKTLSHVCHLNPRTVHYALRWLECRRWIYGFRQRGRVTKYRPWFYLYTDNGNGVQATGGLQTSGM